MSPQNRLIASVLGIVAVIAGAWFLVLSPKRAEVSTITEQIAQAQSRRDAAIAVAAQAEQARERYPRDYATVARLGKAVPGDDDVASLIYQLETLARANKIDFRSVRLTSSGAAAATPTPPAPAEGQDAKKDEASDPSAAPATPVAPVVAQPPPGGVVGTAGLLTLPFTFTFDGDYLKFQRLLASIDGLANNRNERISVRGRLLTVDGFVLSAGPKGFPKLKAVVSATAYLLPQVPAAAAGATPQSPAGATAGATGTTATATAGAQAAAG